MSLFAPRSPLSEPKKPSWRFFSSSQPPVPAMPPLPADTPSTKFHYRTHSSLTPPLTLGSGAQVVRTPSEARRGIMKSKPKEAKLAMQMPQSAELPMMEECDRRISFSAWPPATPPASAPGDKKSLQKSISMANLGSQNRDRDRDRARRSAIPGTSFDRSVQRGSLTPHMRTPSTSTVPFSAALIDLTQKPAPTAQDQVNIRIEFGFSLDDRSNTSALTLPLDILQKAGGYLVGFIEGHLDQMKCRAERKVLEEKGIRIVSDTPSDESKPGMTDGESAADSELDSEEYGAVNLLRDEYLRSLWFPSPSIPAVPEPSTLPTRTTQYFTPPKNRAYIRNQYTRQDAYPSPSSPLLPKTAPLAVRRRATYLTLPPADKGQVTQMTILLMRDAGCWHHIAARLVQGYWARMDDKKTASVIMELEWMGMKQMSEELKPKWIEPDTPPVPKLDINPEWMERKQRRMSAKSVKGDPTGVREGAWGMYESEGGHM